MDTKKTFGEQEIDREDQSGFWTYPEVDWTLNCSPSPFCSLPNNLVSVIACPIFLLCFCLRFQLQHGVPLSRCGKTMHGTVKLSAPSGNCHKSVGSAKWSPSPFCSWPNNSVSIIACPVFSFCFCQKSQLQLAPPSGRQDNASGREVNCSSRIGQKVKSFVSHHLRY